MRESSRPEHAAYIGTGTQTCLRKGKHQSPMSWTRISSQLLSTWPHPALPWAPPKDSRHPASASGRERVAHRNRVEDDSCCPESWPSIALGGGQATPRRAGKACPWRSPSRQEPAFGGCCISGPGICKRYAVAAAECIRTE